MAVGRFERWARPSVILGALVFLIGFGALVASLFARPAPAPPVVTFSQDEEAALPQVRGIVSVVESGGLERQLGVDVPAYQAANMRLQALYAELRDVLIEENLWPEALSAPRVFIRPSPQGEVAVLDFTLEAPVALTVADEWRLYLSLEQTALRQGISEIRVLIGGRASDTFLGHIALRDSLP
jgi:hypothetical protein